MELPPAAQAMEAALSLLFGAALGVSYDLFAALRAVSRRSWTRAAADFLFALAAGTGLFLFTQSAAGGRLRLYALCCMLAAWGAYLVTLSPIIRGFFSRAARCLGKMLNALRLKLGIIGRIKKIVKSIFSKGRAGFKIIKTGGHGLVRRAKYEGSARREARKGRYNYPAGGGRPVSVRPRRHSRSRGGDREKQPDKGGV